MEKWLTPVDKQQQNKQCLSNGESEKALDETNVSVKNFFFLLIRSHILKGTWSQQRVSSQSGILQKLSNLEKRKRLSTRRWLMSVFQVKNQT